MSQNYFMTNLLDGAEVQWVPLGEVVNLEKGKQLNKDLLSKKGSFPAYNGGITYSGFTNNYNYNKNTTIISQGGASAGFVNFVTSKFYANAHCYVILPYEGIAENRYVFHFLKSNQEKLTNCQHGAGIPALKRSEILNLKIPIPCPENPKKSLSIQAEIVRILDTFTKLTTQLTSELTTELSARKKQYEYYRDQLMTFGEREVEWKLLGDVAKIKHGKDWKKLKTGEIPVYGSGGIMGYVNTTTYNKPTVLIPRKGSISNIFYVDTPFWNVDTIYYTQIEESKLIPKFFYYFIKTINLKALDTGTGRPSLTQAILNRIKIPIPYPNDPQKSLAEQARIVSLLDKFDTLTHSIREGLPREIELRKKQYEYYRNWLLSFPKPEKQEKGVA